MHNFISAFKVLFDDLPDLFLDLLVEFNLILNFLQFFEIGIYIVEVKKTLYGSLMFLLFMII